MDHLKKSKKKIDFDVVLAIFGHFGGHYGPYFAPGSPQSEGGTGPNDTKTSPNGPKMRLGAILDHLEATFIHFGPFGKVKKKSILTSFWPFFGHFGHPQPYWVGARRCSPAAALGELKILLEGNRFCSRQLVFGV